jgi:hypothetical protein
MRGPALFAAWVTCVVFGCAHPPPPSESPLPPAAPTSEPRASSEPLAGTAWTVEPPPPLIQTQLSPRCHELLSNLAATSATLRFDEDRVSMHADSLGGLALSIDPTFPWSYDQDSRPGAANGPHTRLESLAPGSRMVRVEAEGWTPPYGVFLPCGLPPRELRLSPSGERLTSNVIECGPCSEEAAIDGLVGLSWRRVSRTP